MVYKQKESNKWWYKFTWRGKQVRESTKQTNKRVAQTMESAHKPSLAKGEAGIRDVHVVPTLKEFAENDFLPFTRVSFASKEKTLLYYLNGLNRLLEYERLANSQLDNITMDTISGFIATRQSAGLKTSSV